MTDQVEIPDYETKMARAKKFQSRSRRSLFVWARSMGIDISDVHLAPAHLASAVSVAQDELPQIRIKVCVVFDEESLNSDESIYALRNAVRTSINNMVAQSIKAKPSEVEAHPRVYYEECSIILHCSLGPCSLVTREDHLTVQADYAITAMAIPTMSSFTIEL